MHTQLKSRFRKICDEYISYLWRLSKARSRAGLYEFLEGECSRIAKDMKVLTVGAGGDVNKILYKHASTNNFSVVSLDIDQKRSPDILGDVCTEPLRSLHFDIVIFCEVLEHLRSPCQAIDNIFMGLKPGGRLILSVPFGLPLHDRPNDFFRFTRYGLELVLTKFSDVSIMERNSYFEAIDVIWMRLLMEKTEKAAFLSYVVLPIVFHLKRPITLLLSKIAKPDGFTTGYVATAVKRNA